MSTSHRSSFDDNKSDEVGEWLTSLRCGKYHEAFHDAGWQTLDDVKEMCEDDVIAIVGQGKAGIARRIGKAVSELKAKAADEQQKVMMMKKKSMFSVGGFKMGVSIQYESTSMSDAVEQTKEHAAMDVHQGPHWWVQYEREQVPTALAPKHQAKAKIGWQDRGSPLALAATFFQPHEALVHANFGPLFCKSINIERSRTGARPWPDNMNGYHSNKDPAFKAGSANGDEGLAVDEPLNHMCGRSVIFTNMRMIFVDASYVEIERSADKAPERTKKGIDFVNDLIHSSTLPPDCRHDKVHATLIKENAQNRVGWKNLFTDRKMNPYRPGGPSANMPLRMGANPNGSQTTIEYTYFRSIPLSGILEARLDFVSAARTTAKSRTDARDLRSWEQVFLEAWNNADRKQIGGCCCKEGGSCFRLRHRWVRVILPAILWICGLGVAVVFYITSKTWNKQGAKSKTAFGFAVFFSLMLWLLMLARPFWQFVRRSCCCQRKLTEIDSELEVKRQILVRTVDHGTIVLDVSNVHNTREIVAALNGLIRASGAFTQHAQNTLQTLKRSRKHMENLEKETSEIDRRAARAMSEVDTLVAAGTYDRSSLLNKDDRKKFVKVMAKRFDTSKIRKRFKHRQRKRKGTRKWIDHHISALKGYEDDMASGANQPKRGRRNQRKGTEEVDDDDEPGSGETKDDDGFSDDDSDASDADDDDDNVARDRQRSTIVAMLCSCICCIFWCLTGSRYNPLTWICNCRKLCFCCNGPYYRQYPHLRNDGAGGTGGGGGADEQEKAEK